jgi:hypothetical protein
MPAALWVLAPVLGFHGDAADFASGPLFNPMDGAPWWRIGSHDRSGVLEWLQVPGYCPLKPIDVASLDTAYPADLQMQSCAVKCTRPKCMGVSTYAPDGYPCFCDGYLPEFDTEESGAVCGDLALCEDLCAETAGCFGFALEQGPAAGAGKPRCFLYPEDCKLSLADSMFITDANYITYYKKEVEMPACALGLGIDVSIDKVDDIHYAGGVYTSDMGGSHFEQVEVFASRTPPAYGDVLCPCIDAATVLAKFKYPPYEAVMDCPFQFGGDGSNCLPYQWSNIAPIKDGFNPVYGGGCQAWDTQSGYCYDPVSKMPLKNAPSWCQSSWCYVDAANCVGAAATDITPSMFFPGQPLTYNYATCRIPDHVVRVQWDGLCVGWTVQLKPEPNPCDDFINPGAHICDGAGDGPCHCDPCAACTSGRRLLDDASEKPCMDDHAAAAAVLGSDTVEGHLCSPQWGRMYCEVEAYARACRASCTACHLDPIDAASVDVAAVRAEMMAARLGARGTSSRRLAHHGGVLGNTTDDGFRTVYASFHPEKECLNATDASGNDTSIPPDHNALVSGYNKYTMFDWYADYQVAGETKTQLSFPEDVYYRIEEMEAFCPHNNLMNPMLDKDRCMVKCTVEGAQGSVPGLSRAGPRA